MMDELIRSTIHEALDVEPPPFGLRARVISSIPVDVRSAQRPRRRSFQWAGQWATSIVAIVLAIAVVAGLVVTRSVFSSPSHKSNASLPRIVGPDGVLVTSDGTVYFSDYASGYVFRVASGGSIATVAGRGESAMLSDGGAGDGGPATKAYLWAPGGMAADRNGNLFVADFVGERVRKIDRRGNISTFAGSGAADVPAPNLSGDGGPATAATLSRPIGLAFDKNGALYIADSGNHRIRRVDANGTITSLNLASWSKANAWTPTGLAFDKIGDLYVTDETGCQIVRISGGSSVSVIAGTGTCGYSGDGPAASTQLDDPNGIALDSAGNLYIADTNNHRIRRVDSNGVITTLAGTGTVGFTGDHGPANKAELEYPFDIGVSPSGALYIAESTCICAGPTSPGRLRMVQLSSGTVTTAASAPQTTGQYSKLSSPEGVAVAPDGTVYVSDYVNDRVFKLRSDGSLKSIAGGGVGKDGKATDAWLNHPGALAVDVQGNLYVADNIGGTIRRIDRQGMISTLTSVYGPLGLAFDSAGVLYVGTFYGELRGIDALGGVTNLDLSSLPPPAPQLGYMAFDAAGNLYVSDRASVPTGQYANPNGGCRIIRLTPTQKHIQVEKSWGITVVAGTGTCGYSGDNGPATSAQINDPNGIVFDSAGNLYFADAGNHRIRRIDKNGIITTVAGTGVAGYSGDKGQAVRAELAYPFGMGITADGVIYIADATCSCMDPPGPGHLRALRLSDGVITTVGAG